MRKTVMKVPNLPHLNLTNNRGVGHKSSQIWVCHRYISISQYENNMKTFILQINYTEKKSI